MNLFGKKEKKRADFLEARLNNLLDERDAEKETVNLLESRLTKLLDERDAEKKAIAEEIFEQEETKRLAEEARKLKEAEKDLATENGEPYINIVSMDMDPENGANVGAIEMDWNAHFIEMLQKNGYVGVSDEDAVDQWFRDVCRHVVLETYESEDQSGHVSRGDLGDGLAEYS